jgi:hypothetical protein
MWPTSDAITVVGRRTKVVARSADVAGGSSQPGGVQRGSRVHDNTARNSVLPAAQTVVIERFHRAGWVIWVCILLFPIGLFALLAPKRVDRGTVAVSDNGKGTVTLRIAGTFHGTSEAAVNGVIARGSSVQDGPTVDEIAEEMRKLNELRERGVLTSEEYEAQKKRLLP